MAKGGAAQQQQQQQQQSANAAKEVPGSQLATGDVGLCRHPTVGRYALVRKASKAKLKWFSSVTLIDPLATKAGESTTEQTKQNDKNKGGGEGSKAASPEKSNLGFTRSDDNKLKGMKGADKTWADIAAATGKHKSQLQARWKELQKEQANNATAQDNNQGNKQGNKNQKQQQQQQQQNKKGGTKGKQEQKGKKGEAESGTGCVDPTTPALIELFASGKLDRAKLFVLAEEIARDRRNFCKRVSSRVYDKTGEEIALDVIQAVADALVIGAGGKMP